MISIIITVYNLKDYIKKCLNSVITQSYTDLQIIVVNDCSTDNSLEILEEYAKNDSRIEIINNKENVGAGMSRRIGINHAKGEYISLIDGDDYVSKDYIKELVQVAKEYDSDMVTSNVYEINEYDSITKKYVFSQEINVYQLVYEKINFIYDQQLNFLNNKLIKKELFDKVEYSDKRYIEDMPTFFPLIYYANKITTINNNDNCIYYYLMRMSSLTHTSDSMKYCLFVCLAAMNVYLFFENKEEEYKKMYSIFKLRNAIGNFIYNKNFDYKKCEKLYPKEYKEFLEKYNDLKTRIY